MARRLPADLSSASQRGLTVVEFYNWKDGYNSVNRGLNLKDTELSDILNMKYTASPYGIGVESRAGVVRLTTLGIGGAIKDIGYYVDANGGEHYLAVASSLLWEATTTTTVPGWTWTSIGDLESNRGRMVPFANKMMVADGGYLKYVNGSTMGLAYDTGSSLANTIDLADTARTTALTGTTTMAGQKFTTPSFGVTGLTLPLVDAVFYMSKTGSPTGTAYVAVFNATTGTTVATSATVDVSTLTTAALGTTFGFTSGYLDESTAYRFAAVYLLGNTTNYVNVHYSTLYTSGSGNHNYWTGTTWVDVAGDSAWMLTPGLPPKASIVEARYGRLFTDDMVNGQRNWLHYSNLNDPFTWSGTGAGYIIMESMAAISAIKNFYNLLLIHCGTGYKSIVKLTGTDPAYDFVVAQILAGTGAITQDVCWNVGNDFLFLDEAGLVSLQTVQNYGSIERAIKSDSVNNLVNSTATTARFAGYCSGDQQYWLDIGDSNYFLVFDVQYGIWTKYKFELGTGVTPSCFGEWNGYSYIGDTAGHLWRLDLKNPVYYDNSSVDYTQYIKTKPMNFGLYSRTKHARFVTPLVRSRFGGTYTLNFYIDLSADVLTSLGYTAPVDPDLTVDEATFTVDEATFALNDDSSNLWSRPVSFEFKTLQVGVENINILNKPMLIMGVSIDAAVLSRR